MNFLFYFFCLNIFIILDDYKFCNCDDSNGEPIRLDGTSDEEAFKKGLDLYQRRERGEIAESTSGYHEDEIEEEAREKTAVIVFGVDPHINDRETIKVALYRLFKDIMQVDDLKLEDLVYVAKLGVDAKYKRPTIVKLSQPHFKDQILFRRRKLRGLRYKIENYLRRAQVEKQRHLLPVMKFYRRMGKYAIIREGVLMVDGKILQNTDFLIARLKQANAANLFTDLVSPPFVKTKFIREYSTFFPLNLTDHRFFNLYDDMIQRVQTTTPSKNDDAEY